MALLGFGIPSLILCLVTGRTFSLKILCHLPQLFYSGTSDRIKREGNGNLGSCIKHLKVEVQFGSFSFTLVLSYITMVFKCSNYEVNGILIYTK